MKIIIYSVTPVIPADNGGAVRTLNIARTLSKKGIDIILVSPKPPHFVNLDNNLDSKIEYIFFNPLNPKILLKIPVIGKMKNFLSFIIFFKQFTLIRAIIRSNLLLTPSLVLQSESIYSAAPLYMLKKIFHLPLVITEFNIESELSLEISNNPIYFHILKRIEKFYLNRCDRVVCMSETDGWILKRKFTIPPEKIFIVPNAANLPVLYNPTLVEINKLKSKYGVPANKKIVLFMGTMEYNPNINAVNVIKSVICPDVCSKISNVVFIIVGKGVQPSRKESIIFTGVVDYIDPYLQMADIAIAPLTEGGGTRLKILEYMAYGKPVVSTSKGAEGLDVINNKHIIIADTWELFSDYIVTLLSEENKREEISRNARSLIEEKYTWEKACENYVRIYQELLQSGKTNDKSFH